MAGATLRDKPLKSPPAPPPPFTNNSWNPFSSPRSDSMTPHREADHLTGLGRTSRASITAFRITLAEALSTECPSLRRSLLSALSVAGSLWLQRYATIGYVTRVFRGGLGVLTLCNKLHYPFSAVFLVWRDRRRSRRLARFRCIVQVHEGYGRCADTVPTVVLLDHPTVTDDVTRTLTRPKLHSEPMDLFSFQRPLPGEAFGAPDKLFLV